MKRKDFVLHQITSIAELHKWLGLNSPNHPLISVIDLSLIKGSDNQKRSISYDFYQISLKKNYDGKLKYGQQYYDFDKGVMTFLAPQQIFSVDGDSPTELEGYSLIVHPDFFRGYPLVTRIKEYGFFSYAVSEALHVSEQEENMILGMMKNIEQETVNAIDQFTQDLIVSHIDLLLNYCNRFYNRQFITRKPANDKILERLEVLLSDLFDHDPIQSNDGTLVQYLATQLNLSPNYLNDLLKSLTGQTTLQHIHSKLIEKAKTLLGNTSLSVGEIAYKLGFDYPQSFNRLFKNKTNQSPNEYRQSLS